MANMQEILRKYMQPIIEEWLKQAYDVGYKVGSEDATRRAHELYMYGRIDGYANAKADVGEIDLDDLSPEVFDEVTDL